MVFTKKIKRYLVSSVVLLCTCRENPNLLWVWSAGLSTVSFACMHIKINENNLESLCLISLYMPLSLSRSLALSLSITLSLALSLSAGAEDSPVQPPEGRCGAPHFAHHPSRKGQIQAQQHSPNTKCHNTSPIILQYPNPIIFRRHCHDESPGLKAILLFDLSS